MELSYTNKMILLRKFADFKRRQGAKSIVFQSLPILGVQADEYFYSYDLIFEATFEAVKKKIEEKKMGVKNV